MWLIQFALRRPISVMVAIIAIALGCVLALSRIEIDIFPRLNLPVIYVAQPYGGMDPAQMEGLLTNYYEYHFLYISGIHHVESRNVQGMALMKLFFHPGTDMSQAMAETIGYVNRARAFMPPGTISPFVTRFDTGSVPVGYLVLSSETRTLAEIQDLALFRVRPMFATLPGVSAPPPFGGNARTVVVRLDADRLRACHVTPLEVVTALTKENTISPSGNLHLGDYYPIVPVNSMVKQIDELRSVPINMGMSPTVYLRDVATVEDAMDIPSGYALMNGRRAIYMVVTKRADASTLAVVNAVKAALQRMQKELPDDIKVSFEFDQSPIVTGSMWGLATEAGLGALLTGLMVLLFLRDWRSVVVVVLNIPLALMSAVIALWLTGQTINLMTLGGLALAVGILVDEATVEIENIHTQMGRTKSVARAVRLGNAQTAVPRLLAMLCILAVFVPSFFMQGAARGLFVPMSLAVGFSMLASYILSSTFVPVVSTWLLRNVSHTDATFREAGWFERLRLWYHGLMERMIGLRIPIVAGYLGISAVVIVLLGSRLGMEIFPLVDTDQFRLRLRGPDGMHIDRTEQIATDALKLIKQKVGAANIAITLGYVGMIPSSYPINAVYQWSRGPEEAILWVALKHGSGVDIEKLKEELRQDLAKTMPGVRASFEPADIVNEVMSFGSPTPIDVSVSGASFAENIVFAEKLRRHLAEIPALRDLQFSQSLEYPTVNVNVDREKAGLAGVTPQEIAQSLVTATSSSRFVVPNYWPDPKTGIGYQVQVELPQALTHSMDDLGAMPIKPTATGQLLLRDVAHVDPGTMPGQYDRYNMKRQVSLTANISGEDLGRVSNEVTQAIAATGEPPKGSTVEVRGQIPPMQEMLRGLGVGLALAVVVIFLLLSANFQSWKMAFVTVSTVPAVLTGVVLMLWLTRTTLNIQSFMGTIMAIGVAMANGILLVTFAENQRRTAEIGSDKAATTGRAPNRAAAAAVEGASRRLRPILMTSSAMIAGMLPLALAFGEGGQQTAPLGRAVIGGLAMATLATLVVLPCVFALVQSRAKVSSASLDPDDPQSDFFDRGTSAPAPISQP
jgi:multidrug efflux pump subunit AcrB